MTRPLALAIILASCSVDDGSHHIDVSEPYELGVTALQTTRDTRNGNSVYTLRAYTADGDEVASVRLTTGVIPDLPRLLPGDASGSEILISVLGSDSRMVTHEMEVFRLQATDGQRATAELFRLAAVASTLEREANLVVATPTPGNGEAAYYAESCHGNVLLTTPTVRDCCHSFFLNNPYTQDTLFVRPSDEKVIERHGIASNCKASDGVSSCLGAACFYGPFGFARPIVSDYGSYPFIKKYPYSDSNTYCYPDRTGPSAFGNMTAGSNPTGQGCPGGTSGAYQWDY